MSYFLSFTIVIAAGLWIGIMVLFFSTKLLSTVLPLLRSNKKRINRNGIVAEAVILKMEEIGSLFNDHSMIRLQMRVQPDKGRNFIAEIEKVMEKDKLAMIRSGTIVKVKYDPNNYRQLVLL
jgi:hypothetical protein